LTHPTNTDAVVFDMGHGIWPATTVRSLEQFKFFQRN